MTLKYLQRITLSDMTHVMSMVDTKAINEETLRIYNKLSLKKEFIELFV